MAVLNVLDAKTIDDLQELAKLTGTEKTIVSTGVETRKVSVDSIIGYAANKLANVNIGAPGYGSSGNGVIFIPEGEKIPVNQRTPGCFYLEETRQTSIRTQINIPSSITVAKNLGLRRV